MKRAVVLLLAAAALAQSPPWLPPGEEAPKRLPDGRLQSEVILKAAHEENIKDLDRMTELIETIEKDTKATGSGKVSAGILQGLSEVEKLSKRMRGRMTRY